VKFYTIPVFKLLHPPQIKQGHPCSSIGSILYRQHRLDEIRASGGLVHLSRGLGRNWKKPKIAKLNTREKIATCSLSITI